MANTNLVALADEEAKKSHLMTTVTERCVVIKNPAAASQTMISLDRLSEIRTIKTSYPGLLVIASGLSIIAAAAFYSKEGDGAGIPVGLLGACFVAGYTLSRKAAVVFLVDSEITQTVFGPQSEARKLRESIRLARHKAPGIQQKLSEPQDVRLKRSVFGLLQFRTQRADS